MSITKPQRASTRSHHLHSPVYQDRHDDMDIDPYAPTIVEDLLQVLFVSLFGPKGFFPFHIFLKNSQTLIRV